MSLDVKLKGVEQTGECECLDCGNQHTRSWKEDLFSANITHNLAKMADVAGIHKHVWRPDEIGVTLAKDLITPLREGIQRMKADPETYEQLNPSNGWGSYENFVPWLEEYLRACEDYPDATIYISR